MCALTSPDLERVIELIRCHDPASLKQKASEWTFDASQLSKITISKIQDIIRTFRASTKASSSAPLDTKTIPLEHRNLQTANILFSLKDYPVNAKEPKPDLSPIHKNGTSSHSSATSSEFVTPVTLHGTVNSVPVIPVIAPMGRGKRKSTPSSSSKPRVAKRTKKTPKKKKNQTDRPKAIKVKNGWKCSICETLCKTRKECYVHIQKEHGVIFKHYCRFCSRGFNIKAMLQVHERSHTGEKPYPCPFCNMRFSDKSNRRRHIRRRHSDSTAKNKK